MKKYNYFISYRYYDSSTGYGFGRCTVESTPIKTLKDIQEIENLLLSQRREVGYDNLIIINFQKMEK